MKNVNRTVITTAAIAGLLSGATLQQGCTSERSAKPGMEASGKKMAKIHDCAGKNDCKGLGGCKSGDNGCKFKNSCKGKGGCHVTEKDLK